MPSGRRVRMISLASCAITPRSPPIPAASTDDTDGSVASDPPPFAPVPRWRTVPLCAPSAGSGVKVSDASEERPGSPVHAAPIATFPVPERTSAKSVSSASFASADVAGTTSFGSSSHSGAASASAPAAPGESPANGAGVSPKYPSLTSAVNRVQRVRSSSWVKVSRASSGSKPPRRRSVTCTSRGTSRTSGITSEFFRT